MPRESRRAGPHSVQPVRQVPNDLPQLGPGQLVGGQLDPVPYKLALLLSLVDRQAVEARARRRANPELEHLAERGERVVRTARRLPQAADSQG